VGGVGVVGGGVGVGRGGAARQKGRKRTYKPTFKPLKVISIDRNRVFTTEYFLKALLICGVFCSILNLHFQISFDNFPKIYQSSASSSSRFYADEIVRDSY
jgi:hypothetical protein